ncbi:BREX-2 system phosphatase PglZ [Nocardia cyriacigeorgica]|uniref:BREX-2 system phosphatase PglZ n=1 Tax=Nocardia cyriacigeorgica TaxID=135487 RepID=UPI0018960473|nr:BREX-2 system phosphatase PglZ [Nocardia cyriacigeorgica]MBF6346443.1 BREX-2 system phosphatase PglZ [Nocardia cyriacigeorgica]
MTAASTLPEADLTAVRGQIAGLRSKNYSRGVLAIAAAPVWSGPESFDLDGQQVRVRVAPSVLAIRDAITERRNADWVVILTDREAGELPVGILDHIIAGRLSNLDPWPALRELFRASRQEFHLLSLSNDAARAALRDLDGVNKPAPHGVLTNDHLFSTLAERNFGLPSAEYTPHHVAVWSLDTAATTRFEVWRRNTDAALLEQFYTWISNRLGILGPTFVAVWRAGGPADLVPLGLVAALLGDSSSSFPAPPEITIKVRTLLEVELQGHTLTEHLLTTWGNAATLAVSGADTPDEVLRRAENAVHRLHAEPLVARSDVLPMALAPRIAHFAKALAAAIDSGNLAAAENAWADVVEHRAAHVDTPQAPRDVQVGGAALRLLRRRGRDWPAPGGLIDWLAYYRQDLSWVDGAVNDAFVGADDRELARVADRIVTVVRARRAEADRVFARQLRIEGAHRPSGGDVLGIEDILDRVVKPLTRRPDAPGGYGMNPEEPKPSPVLLVIADGMSAAVSNEVVADALRRHRSQWQECRFAGTDAPMAALAALPSVTRFSRCSLLTGALAEGGQDKERSGFADWLQRNGFRKDRPALFHKAEMELIARGHSLADAVREAIDDTGERPVVACVLNDIDDALDRSDPIGAYWGTSSFKRLDSLLKAASAVGRTVVLVSDHGHVVERREQPSVQRGQQLSARYRPATDTEPEPRDDEVLVTGERVLTPDHRAILALDEQVRYTGLKAGYHGGATPAEVVIPVTILINGAVPQHLDLEIAPPTQPAWWDADRVVTEPAPSSAVIPVKRPKPTPAPKASASGEGLFEVDTPTRTASPAPAGRDRMAELLASELFKQQYHQFRPKFSKATIGQFLQELLDNNGRLPTNRTAEILGVRPARGRAAVAVLAQVLNTDGVVVLSDNGIEVELESGLLFEQYGVAP